ncbi:MAG: hypothetical protein ACLP2P_09745 [Desulfobaccales bacterium]
MKKIVVLSIGFLLILAVGVHAGNFKNFQSLMKSQGFTYVTTQNGFETYKKSNVSFAMRSCDEYCCEGIIVADPMSDEELGANIVWLYGSLQNTLEWKGRKAVDPSMMASRVKILVRQIMANLYQANRTEFAFDYLNVRGQCNPVPDKEYKAGKRPVLVIKLWIP